MTDFDKKGNLVEPKEIEKPEDIDELKTENIEKPELEDSEKPEPVDGKKS